MGVRKRVNRAARIPELAPEIVRASTIRSFGKGGENFRLYRLNGDATGAISDLVSTAPSINRFRG
ncbi:MAG: hypothetical protein DWQ34_02110 [Planctomycetota bacterium]|nr:MAG: hypothetical protein DWQ29_24455 [Planctomycetota bacterium]REJ97469.1 MAG: hypothetical protein DWQ34_02110 [Planctomycetota bacterium]REK20979.1 MAG: hypothetical protein DWQ41_23330 [Planctomycetota bacterium]REK37239.1 MAG: hypothetical protein DWQ45_07250 [Planctomycetota bacterium]